MKPLRPSEGSLFLQAKIENLTPQEILQRKKAAVEEQAATIEELEQRFVRGHDALVEQAASVVEDNHKNASGT